MRENSTTLFIQASSRSYGALGIFQVYGEEATLATHLDSMVVRTGDRAHSNSLQTNELKYGWLVAKDDGALDEVMLAKPEEGIRVLMTHGGGAVCRGVSDYLIGCGMHELTDWSFAKNMPRLAADPLFDPLLAGCITERQIAAVLAAREDASTSGGEPCLPANLLITHRLLLAGPPNAGKSSLLNMLSGYDRAFVHSEAGATRDVVEELVDLGGFAVLLGDLPGFAGNQEGIGGAAWEKAAERLRFAEALLFVCDSSVPWNKATENAAREIAELCGRDRRVLVVLNKSDLPRRLSDSPWRQYFPGAREAAVCSLPEGDASSVIAEAADYLFHGEG